MGQEKENNSQNPGDGNQTGNLGNQACMDLLDREPNGARRRVVGVALVPTVDILENDVGRNARARPYDFTKEWTAAGKVNASGGRVSRCGRLPRSGLLRAP